MDAVMNPLPSLIRAAAWDEGNRSAAKAGRKAWGREDMEAAGDWQANTIAKLYGEGPRGFVRFGYAEALQAQGVLTLATKDFWGVFERAWNAYENSFAEAA